jgi:hypothetical protein
MRFLPQKELEQARFLSLLIQHHEVIIKRLKQQQIALLESIDLEMSKDYELNLDTGEITDAPERDRYSY